MYEFEIKYRPGKTNAVAYVLSRSVHDLCEVSSMISRASISRELIQKEVEADPLLT